MYRKETFFQHVGDRRLNATKKLGTFPDQPNNAGNWLQPTNCHPLSDDNSAVWEGTELWIASSVAPVQAFCILISISGEGSLELLCRGVLAVRRH